MKTGWFLSTARTGHSRSAIGYNLIARRGTARNCPTRYKAPRRRRRSGSGYERTRKLVERSKNKGNVYLLGHVYTISGEFENPGDPVKWSAKPSKTPWCAHYSEQSCEGGEKAGGRRGHQADSLRPRVETAKWIFYNNPAVWNLSRKTIPHYENLNGCSGGI